MHTKPATAWNDPPMVAAKVKPAKEYTGPEMPTFYTPTMPVTAQIQQPSIGQTQFYQPSMIQQQQPQQQPNLSYNPQMLSSAPPQYNPPPTQTFNPVQQMQQVQSVQQPPPQPEKPAVIEKGPIPAEHQIIQNVFDTLLSKCLNSTNVPTMKRKLEDVAKKLEILYDKLRDSTVNIHFYVKIMVCLRFRLFR